jgi:hypothetical protein
MIIFRQTLILFFVLVISAITTEIRSQNTMQIHDAEVPFGQQVTISISITNTDAFVGFQLDIPLSATFGYVANSAVLNPARSNGHMLSASLVNSNSTLRIISFSINNTPFIGNSGEVASFILLAGTVPGTSTLVITDGLISDAGSNNIMTAGINGTLTLLAPNIQVTPASHDFGSNPLGTYADRDVNIQNSGNLPLDVSDIGINSPHFENLGSGTFTLAAGQSTTRTVRFNATIKGTYNQTMSIESTDPDQAVSTVNLNAIAFAVNELHCGNMLVASGLQDTLSLSINNMEPFVGFQFDLLLPAPLSYLIGSAVLNPARSNGHQIIANMINDNTLRVVGFSATNQVFTGDDGVVMSLSFDVNGTGGWYPLNLAGVIIGDETGDNIVSASYNGSLTITAPDIHTDNNLTFGNVPVNDSSDQNLLIYNYGQEDLSISSIIFTNSDFSSEAVYPIIILPGQSQQVQVDFTPSDLGISNGQMRIYSDDPDENPFNVSLNANVFSPNYITVPDLLAGQGTTTTLNVSVENYDEFVGFQFDIVLPTGISYINSSSTLNLSRKQDHSVLVSTLENGAIRVLAFSLQQLPFLGNEGTVVSFGLAINDETTLGIHPINIQNAILGDSNSQNILWSVNQGSIDVVALKAISVNIFLEGPFTGGSMDTTLKNSGLLPLIQPFNTSPWNYSGSETAVEIPDDVVDWVLVELRDAVSPAMATPATILAGWPKALFIRQNGSVVNVEGNQPGILSETVQNNLYIVVRHRNHLDVLSNGPLVLAGNTYTYDFTDAITKAYGGALGYKQIASGVFGMVAGDSDADGEVSVLDFSTWASQFGGSGVYSKADNDLDGEVSVLDFSKWAINFGSGNPVSNPEDQIRYRSQVLK